MTETIQRLKPLIVTWLDLYQATYALHLADKADVDRLHDLWKMGAPTPDSRILRSSYDPRLVQPGNVEKRIVFPSALAKWIVDVSRRRGFPYSETQAIAMTQGEAIY
jgi:hypothetical protein